MARRVVGINIEQRRIIVRAVGEIGEKDCVVTVPCCEAGDNDTIPTEDACCPAGAGVKDTIAVEAAGPVGMDDIECSLSFDLQRIGPLIWEGQGSADPEVGCDGVQMSLRVWCSKDEDGISHWYASGSYRNGDGDILPFSITLEYEGDSLVGVVEVLLTVGGLGELFIIIEDPCNAAATGTGTSTSTSTAEPALGTGSGECPCVANTPNQWTWVITNKVGVCSCAPDNGMVTWDGGNSRWGDVTFACPLFECEENATNYLYCYQGTYEYGPVGAGPNGGAVQAVCTDTTVAFNVTPTFGGSYTITFTKVP